MCLWDDLLLWHRFNAIYGHWKPSNRKILQTNEVYFKDEYYMKLIDERCRCQTEVSVSSTNQQLPFEPSLVNAQIHVYTYIQASQSEERTKRVTIFIWT